MQNDETHLEANACKYTFQLFHLIRWGNFTAIIKMVHFVEFKVVVVLAFPVCVNAICLDDGELVLIWLQAFNYHSVPHKNIASEGPYFHSLLVSRSI